MSDDAEIEEFELHRFTPSQLRAHLDRRENTQEAVATCESMQNDYQELELIASIMAQNLTEQSKPYCTAECRYNMVIKDIEKAANEAILSRYYEAIKKLKNKKEDVIKVREKYNKINITLQNHYIFEGSNK